MTYLFLCLAQIMIAFVAFRLGKLIKNGTVTSSAPALAIALAIASGSLLMVSLNLHSEAHAVVKEGK